MIYNILIIGAGGIGKRHTKAYLATGRASISIVEPDAQKRQKFIKEYKIQNSYSSLNEINQKFDIVLICSPANWHVKHMNYCINNNLAFMVEKPLSINLEGLEEILYSVQKKIYLQESDIQEEIALKQEL